MGYEQTPSEKGTGRGKRTCTRWEYATVEACIIESQVYHDETMRKIGERTNQIGVNPRDKIIEGSNDRMNAVLYEPQKYDNPQEQGAYCEGFIIHGTRRLSANLRNLSPEELYNIGYNDCISGIGINALLEPIKINKQYLEGYKKALQSEQATVFGPPKPKHR